MQVRSRVGGRTCIDSGHGVPHARPHRRQGQPALPRRDDVRRLGQPRPRRVDPDHPPRARRRHQLHRHRRRLLARASRRRSSARRSPAAGATTSCSRRRSTARWATTRTSAATRAAGSSREVEDSLRRLGTDWIDLYQIHRPEPGHRHRRDARRADRPRPRRARSATSARSTFPASQIVEAQWVAERRGRERFVCEQPPYSMLVRGIEADVLPTCAALRHGRDPVEPARRRLADRAATARAQRAAAARRAPSGCRGRFDLVAARRTSASSTPPTRSRSSPSEAGHAADPPGARVRARPPGGHLGDHRPAHDGAARDPARAPPTSTLDDDVLDRIDEIVPPGHEPQPGRRRLRRRRRSPTRRSGAASGLAARLRPGSPAGRRHAGARVRGRTGRQRRRGDGGRAAPRRLARRRAGLRRPARRPGSRRRADAPHAARRGRRPGAGGRTGRAAARLGGDPPLLRPLRRSLGALRERTSASARPAATPRTRASRPL